jgi:hypothetical protein
VQASGDFEETKAHNGELQQADVDMKEDIPTEEQNGTTNKPEKVQVDRTAPAVNGDAEMEDEPAGEEKPNGEDDVEVVKEEEEKPTGDDTAEPEEETDEVKLAVKEANNLPAGFVEWEAVSHPALSSVSARPPH